MKTLIIVALMAGAVVGLSGCGKPSDTSRASIKSPAFMFWCYRDEVVSSDYTVPEMTTAAAATYLQNRMKTVHGYVSSRCDLDKHILSVSYESSAVRKMNFEEAIALSGFSVNGRPASPKAQIPAGVKE